MTYASALGSVVHNYDLLFCDIWGTLHNGVEAFPESVEAILRARDEGVGAILVTNSPKPGTFVRQQLTRYGIYEDVYDALITSGDCTLSLLQASPLERLYVIGSEEDMILFDYLDCHLVEEPEEAEVIVVSGLRDDRNETPDDYLPILDEAMNSELPMICVNPDLYVHLGNQKLWCAGALARLYREAGGEVVYAGKPYHPIYQMGMAMAKDFLGRTIDRDRVLMIGDNPNTDWRGAANNDLAMFLVGLGHDEDHDAKARALMLKPEFRNCLVGQAPKLCW